MHQPLSSAAAALLAELRRTDHAHPRTDAALAAAIGIPERDVVDVAGELLGAGHLVLADGRGRWLGTPQEAAAYLASLRRRAIMILRRRRAVRRAIEGQTIGDRTLFDQSAPPRGHGVVSR